MPNFLQSPEWAEVQERMGRPTLWVDGALLVRHDLPFGCHYLYAPRPETSSPQFFLQVRERARMEGSAFLRIDPGSETFEFPKDGRWREGYSLQPRENAWLSLISEENIMLSRMHPKTRYNIRLAARKGVKVRFFSGSEAVKRFEIFWDLLLETGRRDGFSLHPVKHYLALLNVRSDVFLNELVIAECGGLSLAGAIINFFLPSRTATYLHGSSSRNRRELMAPVLLHWDVIRRARAQNFLTYDLGGIDARRWPGLTRFKKNFGAEVKVFPPSADWVFQPLVYELYRLGRYIW